MCSWNVHGKHLSAITNLLNGMEGPPEILCLQELGGFARLPKGETITETVTISGVSCTVVVYQAPLAHHAIAVLFQDNLRIEVRKQHPFGAGILSHSTCLGLSCAESLGLWWLCCVE